MIDLLVSGAEVELENLLLFGRQVAGHLLFRAPQHEGADPSTQLSQSLGVCLLFDRHPVVLGEAVGTGEQPRGDDGEQSDLDLLVTLGEKRTPFFPGGLKADLEDLLLCEVDIVTENALHKLIRSQILKEAKPI